LGRGNMRILLIDIIRTTLEEVWPSAEHSLGLMYLASSLRRRFQSKVTLHIWTLVSRHNRFNDEKETLLKQLKEFTPDMVGVRCLSIGKDSLHIAVEVVKNWNGRCFVVVGGPYATDAPRDVLWNDSVDCVVIGEGEITVQELVERLLKEQPIAGIPGIAYRRGGEITQTESRNPIFELDSLPFPDYSLIDFDAFTNRYLTFSSKIYKPHANILTTRGCPFRCMYCHNIHGKKFRTRSPENVLSEIRSLYEEYGFRDFQIIDDIFNLDVKRAKLICDLILKSGMRITLSFPNGVRGDMMDEELIEKMAAAGTKFISYAIETASPRLQRMIRKNLRLEKVFRAIDYTAKVGIITRGFFMLGFPTETEQEALQTIEFARASTLCGATFFTVVYFPGTELYKLAQSLGYFQDEGYEIRRDYVQVGEGPYEFSLETLTDLKKKGIQEFAFTQERIKNAMKILPNYFTQREIDGFFMAYVVSSGLTLNEIMDETVKRFLHRYFVVAERFSRGQEFYV
jgi:anaerobic magnesium-protoporphyrin IX monomethyl ester cyclase